MTLQAFDSMGQPVNSGDKILDFRGVQATFVRASRARTSDGRSGKVVVKWIDSIALYECEYYDKVFDLFVKDI